MRMNNEGKGKLFVIIIIVIVFFAVLVKLGGTTEPTQSEPYQQQTTVQTSDQTPEPTEEPVIEYIVATYDDMMEALDKNALKAESTYQDAYIEVTGKLSNIDSDGKYISLSSTTNKLSLKSLMCYIKSEDQKNQVMDMEKDDVITVRMKITSIGEVLGYSGDIIEFVK